ncbi:MAG: hypothetical protein PHQ66_01775 [Candidatus Nanoarchaeia archaeon]|nr:hypothetical protein [Candidatus Nanoarchaeia archaeon]MDD5357897.1 hypothetical protein [Candidatus Nanoarchaeia archaeon]MDD5588816.1 hypothetical protein [Candidatus Nanoarchaeia archaeon]
MSQTFSEDFKKFFLIKFTEELIKHSEKMELRKLQGIIDIKERRKFAPRKKIIRTEYKKLPSEGIIKTEFEISLPEKVFRKPATRKRIIRMMEVQKPSLLIPESKLPAHLEYLKPIPTAGVEIDLWKLNPLIKDPSVRLIEVNPDEKVIVTGAMGTRPTGIILNKEDITRVMNAFSVASKIPVEEGVYRVAVGNLILSAVISEVVGSRFIIRKMAASRKPQYASATPRVSFG